MRRAVKISLSALGAVLGLALLVAAAVLVVGNSAGGRAMIERLTDRLSAGHVKLSGLGGSFPADVTLAQLQLSDSRGVWLTADRVSIHWSPIALLERRIQVDRLRVARLDIERAPLSEQSSDRASIPRFDVEQFSIDVLQLGAQLAGLPATLSVHGSARLLSLEDASADVVAHRSDGEGEYRLQLRFDPARMDAALELHEPASGPLENILQLPGLGVLSATLSLKGPRDAEHIEVELSAGELRARAAGTVDLLNSSGDLEYSLESSAMTPRPDIGWQSLSLKGRWRGTLSSPIGEGRLDVDRLQLAGGTQIARLSANLTASGGTVAAQAVANGLQIPGPKPQLLAEDPLHINASMRVNEPSLPLELAATHRLFSLRAQATVAGQQAVTLDLRVPDMAPFAALVGQDVRGDAAIKAQLARRRTDMGVTVDASVGLSAAPAGWSEVLGKRVALHLSGALSDEAIDIEHLQLSGRAATLALSGRASRPRANAAGASTGRSRTLDDYIAKVQVRWDFKISDLALIVPELGGELHGSGHLNGPPSSLAGDADLTSTLSIRGSPPGTVSAKLQARGLPAAPSATLLAQGVVDGAPLKVDAALDYDARRGVRAVVRQADWKSAHLEGEMAVESTIADSRGELGLRLDQLSDFDRILGVNLEGGLEGRAIFTPVAGRTHAQFQLDGRDLVAGEFSGTVHLAGEGDTSSVAMQLTVQAPDLSGAPANVSSSALLNVDTRKLRVASAVAHYRGQELKLLSPAQFSFANGLSVDRLKIGAQDAVLQLEGDLWPALDMRASLRQVEPKLVNAFVPDLLAAGTIEGRARLQGRLSSPTGDVSLTATGMRVASVEAAGLPALDLHASAQLADNAASIDFRLSAAGVSLLTASGHAPLNADGALDLKILGKLDIGLASPLFEARGMQVGGKLAVDATVTGNSSAPQIQGTIMLANGNFRDFAHGVSFSDISAKLSGSQDTLHIDSFKAAAASGTVTMAGTIGALQPGIPVDLKLTATKAQPIASNIVTANLNADIHVSGTAREHIDVAGTIRVNRATIGIPDSLPPEVAVLDVRRRGQSAPAAAGKQLIVAFDVAVQAPQQILVQGRGLDAEMGGAVHVSGTSDAPLISGGFELLRGSFTIAGSKLTFTEGRVSFDGAGLKKKINPTLDFTAKTTLTDATVVLQVSGHADSPQFDFSSIPAGMPQDEIMARLLFGESASQLSTLQLAEIGAALATLSGVGGGGDNPLVKLQKTLGLDRLSVGAGTTTSATGTPENSGAAIEAGRYVTKRVYIEAKQSTTGTSQVQVDIDLTKHLKLQTRLGNGTAITQGTTPENDPGSSIGLSYQFEY